MIFVTQLHYRKKYCIHIRRNQLFLLLLIATLVKILRGGYCSGIKLQVLLVFALLKYTKYCWSRVARLGPLEEKATTASVIAAVAFSGADAELPALMLMVRVSSILACRNFWASEVALTFLGSDAALLRRYIATALCKASFTKWKAGPPLFCCWCCLFHASTYRLLYSLTKLKVKYKQFIFSYLVLYAVDLKTRI